MVENDTVTQDKFQTCCTSGVLLPPLLSLRGDYIHSQYFKCVSIHELCKAFSSTLKCFMLKLPQVEDECEPYNAPICVV